MLIVRNGQQALSSLKTLADSFTRNAVLRNHPQARVFSEKFPLVIKKYPPPENLADIIRDSKDVQKRSTNVKAKMTDWYMHKEETYGKEIFTGIERLEKWPSWAGPEPISSFKWVSDKAIELADENNPHKIKMEVGEVWGALYRKGEYTKEHDHWPNLWSFVYTVEGCTDCAPLVFPNSRSTSPIMTEKGNMILFPAWVLHQVPSHRCNHDRIIVAGNISLSK